MILGLGNDLIDIRRIEATLARFGDRFRNRVFTKIEQAKSEGRAQTAASYAKRFAAKEACSKRWEPGFGVACSGAIWAWSTCLRAGRPYNSPGARLPSCGA